MKFLALQWKQKKLLHSRQQSAVARLVRSRGGMVWWKVGEGKTRIALFIFAWLQNAYKWSRPSICLVVCRRGAFHDWRTEIETCFPGSPIYENDCPVYPPHNRPSFLLVSHGDMARTRKVKGKNRSNVKFANLQDNALIRFVVLDELWLYANYKSERSIAARTLTSGRKAVGLSGTVMKARDTSEVYCQAMAVGKHKYLAPSLTRFRTMHQKCRTIGNEKFPRTFPKKGAYKRIMRDIREVADIHFPVGDRLIHEQFHTIEATPQQTAYFRELKEFYSIEALGLEYDHAIVISTKAQQIADGWIETKEGKLIIVPTNKHEKLADEITDITAAGERVVVWCAFRNDVAYLAKRLPFATVQMVGGKVFNLDKWRDSDVRVCLATEDSGSSVNHFADTPYAIYYSANYKWLSMQQSRGRTDRGRASRHSTCFYKYLQVAGSMDSHVYRTALAAGSDERKLITAGVSNWLRT